jgi:hypothetical protein
LSHRRLLIWSSALDWVGALMLRPSREFGKHEKRRCAARQDCVPTCLASAGRGEPLPSWPKFQAFKPGRDAQADLALRLSGCKAIEFAEPPTRTLPPCQIWPYSDSIPPNKKGQLARACFVGVVVLSRDGDAGGDRRA